MKYADYSDGVFQSKDQNLELPDDLDIPTFMFDHRSPIRPDPDQTNPVWFVDPKSKRELRYKEARSLVDGIAKAFKAEYGLGEDQVVIIFSGNSLFYGLTMWGSHRLGAIVSCANPTYTAGELLYQIKKCQETYKVKAVIIAPESVDIASEAVKEAGLPASCIALLETATSSSIPSVEQLIEKHSSKPAVQPYKLKKGQAKTKVALLSMSSGTTGLPKAVVICHYSVTTNVLQSVASREGSLKGTTVAVLPFYHIYGLVVILHANTYASLKLVLMPKFVFTDFLQNIADYKVTHLFLVPPMIVLLCKHPAAAKADLSSVKFAMTGAAPMTVETMQAFRKKLPQSAIGQGYGLTETCTLVTWYPHNRKDFPGGSAGVLVPNIKVRIVNADGKFCGPDEIGEIWFNSPSNAKEYLNNEKATKETFDENGYMHTGDEGYFDKDGCLYVVDRIKELIKTKGMQVAPAELEGMLLDHPDVDDVCVIGLKDEYSGELPKAFVVLNSNTAKKVHGDKKKADEVIQSIKDFVSKKTVRYKWLDGGVEFIDVIPKNPSGKLLRRVLRDRANRVGGAKL